jgi:hypothetical protein
MEFTPHPYDVLGVSPLASPGEILKAFTVAMQRKEYAPAILANARKILMDPAQRTLAHYYYGSWSDQAKGAVDVTASTAESIDILQTRIDRLQLEIDHLNNPSDLPHLTKAQATEAREQLTELLRQDFLNS